MSNYIPHAVVKRIFLDKNTIIQAWRLHLNLDVKQLSEELGITIEDFKELEKTSHNHKTQLLVDLAKVMGVSVKQILN